MFLCLVVVHDTDDRSGIGLETSILFAKEGASILMSDISQPALEKAAAKVKQLVPNAPRVEILVRPITHRITTSTVVLTRNRKSTSQRNQRSRP